MKIKVFGSKTTFLEAPSHFCASDLNYFLSGVEENKFLFFLFFYCDLFLQLSPVPCPDLGWVKFLTESRPKHISEFTIFVQQPELRKYKFSVEMQISSLQENPIYCSPSTWNICWCIFFFFFSPATLLFATNQTNLKQKQSFSVLFEVCKC